MSRVCWFAIVGLVGGVQDGRAQPSDPVPSVVVQGLRASAESAEARRRMAPGVLDAVVAADLQKLPDLSVADALQRITGIQVTRDRGEASTFAIRGLTQVETLLNGREVFTAGSGRQLDLADVASEMVVGIDVYKTPAAEQLDGALGGSVNLRTRRPLDLPGNLTAGSLRWIYGDLVRQGAAQGSLLVSRRFKLDDGASLGWLLNLVSQDRAWREDLKSTGAPLQRNDLWPDHPVAVPNGTSETTSLGVRHRQGLSLVAQWRPQEATEVLVEAHATELNTRQDSHQVNLGTGKGFDPGSVQLFDGSWDVKRITWTDAPVSVLGFARDTLDRTRQLALGARHGFGGAWTAAVDASHTRSENQLFFSGPVIAAQAPLFTQDLSGQAPSTQVPGSTLLDPQQWHTTSLAYRLRPFVGELSALRADLQWHPASGLVERLAFGARSALRRAHNGAGLVFGDVAVAAANSGVQGRVQGNPYGPLLGGEVASVDNHLILNLDGARDPVALRGLYGVTAPIPVEGSALGRWDIRERTDAAYLQADWAAADHRLQGQVGLRMTHSDLRVRGFQAVPSAGGVQPLQVNHGNTDWLPSAALRWRATPDVQMRLAASRSITRPNFDQLSPSLTLVPNRVNPELNVGGAGNPQLRAMRATNLDLALESARTERSSWSATVFWKAVDGFITGDTRPELWDGAVYQVTRPYNADPARIRGIELGGTGFFSHLPGAWSGLGLQANYTLVDSSTPDRRLGREVPLQNMSRHSANLIGLFERGHFSARLAWNWRSRFLSGVNSAGSFGSLPVYTRGYGWLDGALRWRIDKRWAVSVEGGNLWRQLRTAYHGVPTRPQSAVMNDRQWALSLLAEL